MSQNILRAFVDNVGQMFVIQIFLEIFGNKRLDNCLKLCPIICYSKLFESESKQLNWFRSLFLPTPFAFKKLHFRCTFASIISAGYQTNLIYICSIRFMTLTLFALEQFMHLRCRTVILENIISKAKTAQSHCIKSTCLLNIIWSHKTHLGCSLITSSLRKVFPVWQLELKSG